MSSATTSFALLANGSTLPWSEVPTWTPDALVEATARELGEGGRLCAWFGQPEAGGVAADWAGRTFAPNLIATTRSQARRVGWVDMRGTSWGGGLG